MKISSNVALVVLALGATVFGIEITTARSVLGGQRRQIAESKSGRNSGNDNSAFNREFFTDQKTIALSNQVQDLLKQLNLYKVVENNYKKENDALSAKVNELAQTVANLQAKSIIAQNNAGKTEIIVKEEAASVDTDKLNDVNAKLATENSNMRKYLKEYLQDYSKVQLELSELKKNFVIVKQKLDYYEASSLNSGDFSSKIIESNKKLTEVSFQNESLVKQVGDLKANIKQVEAERDDLKAQVKSWKNEYNAIKDLNDKTQVDFTEVRVKAANSDAVIAKLNGQIKSLNDYINSMNDKMNKMSDSVSKEIVDNSSVVNDLKAQIKSLNDQISVLNDKVQQGATLQAQLKRSQDSIAQLKNLIIFLKKQIETNKRKVTMLEAEKIENSQKTDNNETNNWINQRIREENFNTQNRAASTIVVGSTHDN